MSQIKMKPLVACFLGLSLVIWVVILSLAKIDYRLSLDSIKQLPTVLSYDMVIWGFFVQWGWKWRIFRGWLVPFPNLDGTWRGTYNSTWVDPATGASPPEGDMVLVIRQSFLTINCTVFTKELTSRSYAAAFHLDDQSGIRKLVYVYVGDPKQSVRSRSQIHKGTAELEIIGQDSVILRGAYWTDRNSTGDLAFSYAGRAKAESFEEQISQRAS